MYKLALYESLGSILSSGAVCGAPFLWGEPVGVSRCVAWHMHSSLALKGQHRYTSAPNTRAILDELRNVIGKPQAHADIETLNRKPNMISPAVSAHRHFVNPETLAPHNRAKIHTGRRCRASPYGNFARLFGSTVCEGPNKSNSQIPSDRAKLIINANGRNTQPQNQYSSRRRWAIPSTQ